MDKNLIIDVGVHTGQDTEFYLKKGFRVIGIEADPQIYESAKNRLNYYIDNGQLTLLNIAVSTKDEPVTFYANSDRTFWGTTSLYQVNKTKLSFGTPFVEITVEGCRFEKILEQFGIPYYLKVDIEGTEILCVNALRQFDEKPQFISIESTKTSWDTWLNELAVFKELGYQKFKAINQAEVPKQVCPSPAREGQYIPYQFEYGASGLFGEETPGNWLSESEIIKVYKGIFWNYKTLGINGIISRLPGGKLLLDKLNIKEPWYDIHTSL
ncbi:FkbM family methyltransferase [Nostoc sp. C117]|uniref:FkbM family methyltransferase n=1 Tax=Nostoc sp. C117 TaxID=3349875 RepID=UPI00370DD81B